MEKCIWHIHSAKNWGGGEQQLIALVKRLNKLGYENQVFALQGGELYRRCLKQGITVHALEKLSEQSVGPSIIHSHDSLSLKLGGRARRKWKVRHTYTRRIASPLRQNVFSRLKYSSWNVDRIMAISETVKNVLEDSGIHEERIVVVPSGLDLSKIDLAQEEDELRRQFLPYPIIGGLGRLSKGKQWHLLVELAALLREQEFLAHWLIYGAGEEEEVLRKLIREKGLETWVHLMGFTREPLNVLKSLDLLFFPSRIEGAALTVREAMALGTPVVAFDSAGVRESLHDCGSLFGENDLAAAAQAVREMLFEDKEGMQQRADEGRSYAREAYSLDKTVKGALSVYEKLWA